MNANIIPGVSSLEIDFEKIYSYSEVLPEADPFMETLGATHRVWIDPGVRTCSHDGIRYSNPSFFRRADFEEAVRQAAKAVKHHCDWNIEVTRNRGAAHFTVYSANPNTYEGMYLGNWYHAAGLYRGNGVIYIHDGYIPAWTDKYNETFWWSFVGGTIRGLAGLILHEMGHKWLDGHDLVLSRLMSKNKSTPESQWARRKFGAPNVPTKPEFREIWFNDTEHIEQGEVRWRYHINKKCTQELFIDGEKIGQRNGFGPTTHTQRFRGMSPGDHTVSMKFTNNIGTTEVKKQVSVPGQPTENPFHNKDNPFDVSGNGRVSAMDALRILNVVNKKGGEVSIDDLEFNGNYYDVNNDRKVSALDAIQVINYLNRNSEDLDREFVALEEAQQLLEQGYMISLKEDSPMYKRATL